MPGFSFQYQHNEVPDGLSGYELAPIPDKGFFSLVNYTTGGFVNFNSYSVKVLAYAGGGLPPIENILTPYGLLGGSYLQRTVVRPRTIVLACAVQKENHQNLQRLKQALSNLIAPSNALQAPKNLGLRFQLVDACGAAIGTALDCPVVYQGGLEGSVDNLYAEKFSISFLELAPPSITELATLQPSLLFAVTPGATNTLHYRDLQGVWHDIVGGQILAVGLAYDANGLLWFGSRAGGVTKVQNINGTNTSPSLLIGASQGSVNALAFGPTDNVYAGGQFNNTGPYIIYFNGSTWAGLPSSTINNTVQAMDFDNTGLLYFGGSFTNPGNYGAVFNPATNGYSTLGTGFNNTVYAVKKGIDGSIYFGGVFTTANGVACNLIAKYLNGTFVPLGSGMNVTGSTAVFSIDVLPNGNIVAAGAFSTAGGVACNNIALWNGTSWQPLGSGLTGGIINIAVNKTNGNIYAYGNFSYNAAGNYTITYKVAMWNGSIWLPLDLNENVASLAQNGMITCRSSDGQVAVVSGTNAVTYAGSNALKYSGTADCFPQIKLTGPGQIFNIINYTTGKALYFNYALIAGETATLTQGGTLGLSFVSSFYGNVLNKILPGSDLSSFALVPGTNNINCLMTGTTGASKIEFIYKNTHWSFDAGA
jgi:hypothetical protein